MRKLSLPTVVQRMTVVDGMVSQNQSSGFSTHVSAGAWPTAAQRGRIVPLHGQVNEAAIPPQLSDPVWRENCGMGLNWRGQGQGQKRTQEGIQSPSLSGQAVSKCLSPSHERSDLLGIPSPLEGEGEERGGDHPPPTLFLPLRGEEPCFPND